jgi:hypothetical protein
MAWVAPDVVHDINQAVGRRWQGLDPLLPEPGDLPQGCMAPLVVYERSGRPTGLGVCHHESVPDDALAQTWGAAYGGGRRAAEGVPRPRLLGEDRRGSGPGHPPGGSRRWSATYTTSSTHAASRLRCCTTRRSTRYRDRSGTGWDTGRSGPSGKRGPPRPCGDRAGNVTRSALIFTARSRMLNPEMWRDGRRGQTPQEKT